MEEILASIRRIIEDNDGERPVQPSAGHAGPEIAPAIDHDHAAVEIASFRAELGAPAAERRAPPQMPVIPVVTEADLSKPAAASVEEEHAMPDLEPEAVAPPPPRPRVEPPVFQTRAEPPALKVPANAARPESAPASAVAAADLVSAAAGRKVAAAFGELTEAFAAQRRRSFDEMAEEMLRPMLRDWLDENLPTMVERLVREEIERIARGDHR